MPRRRDWKGCRRGDGPHPTLPESTARARRDAGRAQRTTRGGRPRNGNVWVTAQPTSHDLPAEIYALFEAQPDVREALFFDEGHPDAEGFEVFARALMGPVSRLLPEPKRADARGQHPGQGFVSSHVQVIGSALKTILFGILGTTTGGPIRVSTSPWLTCPSARSCPGSALRTFRFSQGRVSEGSTRTVPQIPAVSSLGDHGRLQLPPKNLYSAVLRGNAAGLRSVSAMVVR